MTAQLSPMSLAGKLFGGGHWRRLTTGAVALTAALAAGGAGATAEAATTESAAAPPAATAHCVGDVSGGQDARCFASFPAAIRYATDGRVAAASASPRAAMADGRLAAQLNAAGRAQSSFIVGIMYQHINYGGASWTWTGTGGCTDTTADVDFWAASMPAGWDNVVSSMKGFSNCGMKVFEHPNFLGVSSDAYYLTQPFVGVLNDHASSIRWS